MEDNACLFSIGISRSREGQTRIYFDLRGFSHGESLVFGPRLRKRKELSTFESADPDEAQLGRVTEGRAGNKNLKISLTKIRRIMKRQKIVINFNFLTGNENLQRKLI